MADISSSTQTSTSSNTTSESTNFNVQSLFVKHIIDLGDEFNASPLPFLNLDRSSQNQKFPTLNLVVHCIQAKMVKPNQVFIFLSGPTWLQAEPCGIYIVTDVADNFLFSNKLHNDKLSPVPCLLNITDSVFLPVLTSFGLSMLCSSNFIKSLNLIPYTPSQESHVTSPTVAAESEISLKLKKLEFEIRPLVLLCLNNTNLIEEYAPNNVLNSSSSIIKVSAQFKNSSCTTLPACQPNNFQQLLLANFNLTPSKLVSGKLSALHISNFYFSPIIEKDNLKQACANLVSVFSSLFGYQFISSIFVDWISKINDMNNTSLMSVLSLPYAIECISDSLLNLALALRSKENFIFKNNPDQLVVVLKDSLSLSISEFKDQDLLNRIQCIEKRSLTLSPTSNKFPKFSKDSQPRREFSTSINNNNVTNTTIPRVCMNQLKHVFCTSSSDCRPCKYKNGTCKFSHFIYRKYDAKLYNMYMHTINFMKPSPEKDELLHVIVPP
jgi:hypothetical protein